MGRLAGVPNKLTTEVKDKLQTVMDDVVSQLDITEMTTDQKIKILQIGLQYLLPKLKHVSGEAE
jgi:phospholipid N-methyltransferase